MTKLLFELAFVAVIFASAISTPVEVTSQPHPAWVTHDALPSVVRNLTGSELVQYLDRHSLSKSLLEHECFSHVQHHTYDAPFSNMSFYAEVSDPACVRAKMGNFTVLVDDRDEFHRDLKPTKTLDKRIYPYPTAGVDRQCDQPANGGCVDFIEGYVLPKGYANGDTEFAIINQVKSTVQSGAYYFSLQAPGSSFWLPGVTRIGFSIDTACNTDYKCWQCDTSAAVQTAGVLTWGMWNLRDIQGQDAGSGNVKYYQKSTGVVVRTGAWQGGGPTKTNGVVGQLVWRMTNFYIPNSELGNCYRDYRVRGS